jgi:hypothetical protein
VSRDWDNAAALHLVFALAALAEGLAGLREAQDRLAQAWAARHVAGQLRQYRPPAGTAHASAPGAQAVRAPVSEPIERHGRQR